MRYRIAAILAALTALVGLSAPIASAHPAPRLAPVSIMATCNPCDIAPNANTNVAINYPGAGNQAQVTSAGGTSYVQFVKILGGSSVYTIHNHNGDCLRMRDGNNGFAVMEESGCNTGDSYQLWYWMQAGNLQQFQNVAAYPYYLGVGCPPQDGSKLVGQTGRPGTCVNWQFLAT